MGRWRSCLISTAAQAPRCATGKVQWWMAQIAIGMAEMTWLESRQNWLPNTSQKKVRKPASKQSYTITEVAEIFEVTRQTVYKWLISDDLGEAIISPTLWYKLPGGHIRVAKIAITKLKEQLIVQK